MPEIRVPCALISAGIGVVIGVLGIGPALAQTQTVASVAGLPKAVGPDGTASAGKPSAGTAADAALALANMLDGAAGGISNADLMSALQNAAAAGQPMALWRLGMMYQNGEGVEKNQVKAFGYFSQIANDHADAAPSGVDADIVAQSFVKVGEYLRKGLPDAGIAVNVSRSEGLIFHAATYFHYADAQYMVGEYYLNSKTPNPLQGARWLSLAAHKGHVAAQAKLGDLLFNGDGIKAQPVEGLMWLNVANNRATGTADASWVNELLTKDMAIATAAQRQRALKAAAIVAPQFETPGEGIDGGNVAEYAAPYRYNSVSRPGAEADAPLPTNSAAPASP